MNNALDLYRAPSGGQELLLAQSVTKSDGDRLDLRGLVSTLRRRRGTLVLVALAVFTLVMLLTMSQANRYTATAQVVLNTRAEQVTPVKEQVVAPLAGQDGMVDTEVQVIGARELAGRVVDSLHLERRPEFNPLLAPPGGLKNRVRRMLGMSVKPAAPVAVDPALVRQFVIDGVRSGLSTSRVGLTYALQLSYTSTDPVLSAQIVNEYARQYTGEQKRLKTGANREAAQFLGARIQVLRAQAQADTQRVQQYRIANNLLSTSGATLTEQEISAYNQEVANARAAAAEDQARLGTARSQLQGGSSGDDVGAALDSGVVSGLRGQRAQASAQLANLQGRYGPRHPDVIKMQQEVGDIDQNIQAEINRVISNLDAKARVSSQRVSSLTGSLSGARGTLAQNNRAMVGLDDLERKAATSQALYETYLNRYKETVAQEGTERSDSRIISEAQVPGGPSSPNLILSMILASFLGLGSGLAAAFISEAAYSGITTAEDVEERLKQPYLAGIPLVSSVLPRLTSPVEAIVSYPHSAFSEAFRTLRTSISQTIDVSAQFLLVTSALPQEGKTTAAICLARSLAQQGLSVVLVDADTRRRGVNHFVSPDGPSAGLLEVLRGEATLDEALILDEGSGAWVLPLNRAAAGNTDLLVGEAMATLISQLRERFAHVVMDSAPALAIAETRALAALADAVLFVVRWRSTSDHAVRSALRLLPPHRVNVAGVVLTRIDMRKQARFGFGDPSFYFKHYREYYG